MHFLASGFSVGFFCGGILSFFEGVFYRAVFRSENVRGLIPVSFFRAILCSAFLGILHALFRRGFFPCVLLQGFFPCVLLHKFLCALNRATIPVRSFAWLFPRAPSLGYLA